MPTDLVVADARIAEMVRGWLAAFRPPERLAFADWAERQMRLDDGSRYRPWPLHREIMAALTDPEVGQVTVMKASRVGYSKLLQGLVGYTVDQWPRDVVIYQPTIADAEDYAKTDINEALSIPVLEGLFTKSRDGSNSMRLKQFPGGTLRIKGANSPAEFRRFGADVVLLEEVDGYPPTAGLEGDQVELAWRRTAQSTASLKVAGSTPTIAGFSKIEALFNQSTRERRFVPCPHCGEKQVLVLGDGTGPGLRWEPKEAPERVWYVCGGCGSIIEESHKAAMDAAGEWRAAAPEAWPHRGFQISALYSQLPGASWLEIARAFVRARPNPQKFKVFVNQTLGEPFEARGDAPAWRALYDRREDYPAGIVPAGALVLTGAFDIQKDRLEFAVWGWGRDRQCWLVEHEVIAGSPFTKEPWVRAAELIRQHRQHEDGAMMALAKVAVDAGFATTEVSTFVRQFHPSQVVPVRGTGERAAPVIGHPRTVDPTATAKARHRNLNLWMVGDRVLKAELYGLLALPVPDPGEPHLEGFIHLPMWADQEFCEQMVAEDYLPEKDDWVRRRANEALDLWKYSRAMFTLHACDRFTAAQWDALERAVVGTGAARTENAVAPTMPTRPRPKVIKSLYLNR